MNNLDHEVRTIHLSRDIEHGLDRIKSNFDPGILLIVSFSGLHRYFLLDFTIMRIPFTHKFWKTFGKQFGPGIKKCMSYRFGLGPDITP